MFSGNAAAKCSFRKEPEQEDKYLSDGEGKAVSSRTNPD